MPRTGPTEADAPAPICALCGHARRGDLAEHHLTHGVTITLCAPHRRGRFLRHRHGRTFTERLEANWRANGTATRHRLAALRTHRRRITPPPPRRPIPGSYSWPALRREAERRFSTGEPPNRVIHELRTRHRGGPAAPPSIRTMRRWFTQGRWLPPTPPQPPPKPPRRPPPRRRTLRDVLPELPPGFNRDPLWPLTDIPIGGP